MTNPTEKGPSATRERGHMGLSEGDSANDA